MSSAITYLQITFVFNVGGGAPTNVLMNNVVILDDSAPPPPNVFTMNTFANADEVLDTANGGANAWGNWFGQAFYQANWNGSDASNNPASGSLRVEAFYPDSGIGGCCGPQFLVQNGFNGINPAIAGNGNTLDVPVATNISFDIRFDPMTDLNGSTNWPTIEVGTGGGSLDQYVFGSFTLPATQTNWVRVNVPIGPSANWTNIPHVFFKHYSDTRANWVVFYLDNIQFNLGTVPPASTNNVVIGSWQGTGSALTNTLDEGWIDWGNQSSIVAPTNTGKYSFASGVVAGYSQSLQISRAGYNQNLAIKLHTLPGGVAAFITNHLLSFTFSVPAAASSGSTSGYSQLWELALNASGIPFTSMSFTNLTSTGDTGDNQNNQPNFYFYSGAPARSQVVTLNYSNILSSITATPADGYVEIVFSFNNGGGAPTNYYINNVALSGGLATVAPNNPPPAFTGVSLLPGGAISLTATGSVSTPYRLWASTNVALSPITSTWTLLTNSTVTVSPFTITDSAATNFSRRFYQFSTP